MPLTKALSLFEGQQSFIGGKGGRFVAILHRRHIFGAHNTIHQTPAAL